MKDLPLIKWRIAKETGVNSQYGFPRHHFTITGAKEGLSDKVFINCLFSGILLLCIQFVCPAKESVQRKADVYSNPVTEVLPERAGAGLTGINHGQSFRVLPDSMYGVESIGLIKKLYKWYYYNTSDKPDTSAGNYYNSGYNYAIGHRIYDNEGRLVNFFLQQPRFISTREPGDSSIIVIYNEQNSYEGDKLVNKNITYCTNALYIYIDSLKYEYDSVGRLVHKYEYYWSRVYKTEYLYNKENQLDYMIVIENNRAYNLHKYIYYISDTLRITTEYYGWFPSTVKYDTISSKWKDIYTYTETFDNLNRKTSETMHHYHFYDKSNRYYKTAYLYNKSNQIEHIIFYQSDDTIADPFKAQGKKSYSYTSDGDILYYESTFFDDRTNTWELFESQTYFYPGLITAVAPESLNKTSDNLILYPNPASEVLYIQGFSENHGQYSICNMQGIMVKNGELTGNGINIACLKPGVYIIMVKNKQQVHFGRFSK
ncbi:MAG: T9SS type A sorting domain-containing protein [Bacteroidales bacterium]